MKMLSFIAKSKQKEDVTLVDNKSDCLYNFCHNILILMGSRQKKIMFSYYKYNSGFNIQQCNFFNIKLYI